MGVVYQARQTGMMERPVVIKVVNSALLDHPTALERFRREVQAAAQLSHANIVTAYDAEQAGSLHLLVMEFVAGQSLAEVLDKKGPLPVANACHCARQVALGLQHAHERGMVHRDIKPQNLMLTPKGLVKILDFGLAKIASESRTGTGLTALNAYMGTPEYSAPEQTTDAHSADIRADLYSLGCTLYYLLAGRPPFREDTAVKTILAHHEKEPQPLPELRLDVSAGLWQVVARLLAKDPARRFQTPVEVARRWCRSSSQGRRRTRRRPGALRRRWNRRGRERCSRRIPGRSGPSCETGPGRPRQARSRGRKWRRTRWEIRGNLPLPPSGQVGRGRWGNPRGRAGSAGGCWSLSGSWQSRWAWAPGCWRRGSSRPRVRRLTVRRSSWK
jgi:serine/threonine protein kinase